MGQLHTLNDETSRHRRGRSHSARQATKTHLLVQVLKPDETVSEEKILILFLIYMAILAQNRNPVSVGQILHQLVTESDEERAALALVLTNEPGNVANGRDVLERLALQGRPTAQRHLATYWALTGSDERRARVYQWLLVALACARGIDQQAGTGKEINYLLFLTDIALVENATRDEDKTQGREWAKMWFSSHTDEPGLASCDVDTIGAYSGN